MNIVSRQDAIANGLDRYYTGKPCKHGHVDFRWLISRSCATCVKKINEENRKEYQRRGKEKGTYAAWREKNKEKIAQQVKDYRSAHREHLAERTRQLSLCPERQAKKRASSRRAYAKNPNASIARSANRRARMAKLDGIAQHGDVQRLFREQRGLCAGCARDISHWFHLDHATPLSRGGTNDPSNLQLLCPPCNLQKAARTMEEWKAWKDERPEGFLSAWYASHPKPSRSVA